MSNYIIKDMTLTEYHKKYRNKRKKLYVLTKQEVDNFAKSNPTYPKDYLLLGKRWAYIDNTYYEIPKPIRWTWFRNLHAGIQLGVCALVAVGVVSAILVPIYITINNNIISSYNRNVTILDKNKEVILKHKEYKDRHLEIVLSTLDKTRIVKDIDQITIGEYNLTYMDYSFEVGRNTSTIYISKATLDKYSGAVFLIPIVVDK